MSAYGSVGLSTGVPYDNYSLSGAFQTGSKIVMLALMIRGRHRGLPLAIDRSILLPGEDLMHKMDQHYNEYGELDSGDEAEVEREVEREAERDEESLVGEDHPGSHGAEQVSSDRDSDDR